MQLTDKYTKRLFNIPNHVRNHRTIKEMIDYNGRFQIVSAGRRSFKTELKKRKLCFGTQHLPGALTSDECNYFFAAPTRSQVKRIAWQDLKHLTIPFQKGKPSESELVITLKNDSQIHLIGMDEPARIEGSQWHGGVMDEFGNMKPGTFSEHVDPITVDTGAWIDFIGVPEGAVGEYYDLALIASDNLIPKSIEKYGAFKRSVIHPEWALFTWFTSDVIDRDIIEEKRKILDERSYRQEYEGSFEEIGGRVYWNYSNSNLSDKLFNVLHRTVLMFDFNVNPMTCIINQEFEPDKWVAVKEFVLKNSNTYECCEAVQSWLLEHKFISDYRLETTGDHSGIARKTSAVSRSDWSIINLVFGSYSGYIDKHKRTTSVKERVNTINSRFKSMDGTIYQYVNRETCPELDKDLLRTKWNDSGMGIDDEGGKRGHCSDAISYHAYNYYPIREEQETIITGG